jgi:hypothetical protein
MAGRDWEASGDAADALRTVLDDYGAACLSNAQQMASVLRDLLPDKPREASVLVAAVEADVAAVLRDRAQIGMSATAAAQQAVTVLEDRTGLAPAACQWAVAVFSNALGYPVSVTDLSTGSAPTAPHAPVPPQPTGPPGPAAPQPTARADVPAAAATPPAVASGGSGGVVPPGLHPVAGSPAAGGAAVAGTAALAGAAAGAPSDPPYMQAIAMDAYLVRPGSTGTPQAAGQGGVLPPGALAPNAYMQPPPAAPPATPAAAQPAPVQDAPPFTAPGAAWPGTTAPGADGGPQPTVAAQYPAAPAPPDQAAGQQPNLYPGVAVPTPDNAELEKRRKFFLSARFAFAAALLIAVYSFVAPYPLGVPFAIAFSIAGLSLAVSAVYASRRASATFGGGAVFGASVASVAFLGNLESVFWSRTFFDRSGRPAEAALVLLAALILAVLAAVYSARALRLSPRKPIGFVGLLAAGAALFALANIPAQASEQLGAQWLPLIHVFYPHETGIETLASIAYLVLITLPLAVAALRVNAAAGRAGIWAGWIAAAAAWPVWTTFAIAAAPSSYGLTSYGVPVRADTGLYLTWTCWLLLLVLGAVAMLRRERAQTQFGPPPIAPPAGR